MMKLKPFRLRLRKTCSESAPSGTFSMYATCEPSMFLQRYWRPSGWAGLQPPSSWGPMRTIATLNLPCSTSGIWRFAPPCVPVPAHASAPPPPDALGVLLHAPNARTPTAISESSLSRFVAMVPPPRPPAAREDSAHARTNGDAPTPGTRQCTLDGTDPGSRLREVRPEA